MKMEDRKKNLDINPGSLNLSKKTEDMRLTLRKMKVNEKLISIMEKKYNQTKISEKISTNLDELDLPDEVKMKSFTDDSDFLAFLNFLLDFPAIDYKKFALNLLRINLSSDYFNPKVFKIDASLIIKVLESLKANSDNLNYVFESLTVLYLFGNVITENFVLESVFLNQENLKIIFDIFKNKEIFSIPDIMNVYLIFIHVNLKNETKIKFAQAFNKVGLIESLISILELEKINIEVLSNTLDLILVILENKFGVFDLEQLIKITKNCLTYSLSNENNIKFKCFWIISLLSELESKEIVDHIVKSKLVLDLICKDYSINPETIMPAIRIIGNLAGNEDVYVEFLLKNDVLNFFRKIMHLEEDCIRKEIFWAFCNLTATCKNAIMKILDDDSIIPLSKKLLYCNCFQVKLEVLFFIGGIVEDADYLIAKKIMDWKIDEDIVKLLKDNKNPDLLSTILSIVNQLIDLSLFAKKEITLDGSTLAKTELSNYSRIKSPFRNSFIKKGILEILDKLTLHANEDIVARVENLIFKLKDCI